MAVTLSNSLCEPDMPASKKLAMPVMFALFQMAMPIAGFFGGTLVQDLPGHSSVHGSDRLHSVTAAPSLLRRLYGERCVVNSSHHQSIDRFGAGLEALQWAPDGTVEALRHRTLPILCVQWHPERLSLPGAADGQLLYDAFLSMAKL